MRFLATLVLAAVVLLGFLYLSGGSYFIPMSTLAKLAFGLEQPQNLLAHMVIHTGYAHMIENLATLVVFALIAEALLVSADVVIIFFLSGTAAAMLFSLLNPGVALIGASAGISGLIGSSIVINPKKALAAVVVVPLALVFLILPTADALYTGYHAMLEQETVELSGEIEVAREQGDVEAEQKLTQELGKVEEHKVQQEVGVRFQKETPTDALVHGFGAAFGILYLFAFRRKKLEEGVERYVKLKREIAAKLGKMRSPKGSGEA